MLMRRPITLTCCVALFLNYVITTAPAAAATTQMITSHQEKRLLFPPLSPSPSPPPKPPKPSKDPFYIPPIGFEKTAPGTILASRRVNASSGDGDGSGGGGGFLKASKPLDADVYQLLYRTTSVDGTLALATVTTVFRPYNASTDRFIALATAEDSNSIDCSPSYNYLYQADITNPTVITESYSIQLYVKKGYIVVSPDFEGPDSAFAAGRLEGMAILDSMRAVQSFEPLGLKVKPMIVGFGYSGGAAATGWAAAVQSHYAPELNIVGWALGGTISNLTAMFTFDDGTFFSAFFLLTIKGLCAPSAYPHLLPVIEELATTNFKEALNDTLTHCSQDIVLKHPFIKFASTKYFTSGDQILYDPRIASVLQENTMGLRKNEVPKVPMFIYHAKHDEIIPYSDANRLVDMYCSNGATVHFTTYAGGGHITTEAAATVQLADFVSGTFNGSITADGTCIRDAVNNATLDPMALGLDLEPILLSLISSLGSLTQYL